ncbi:MAG: hypothetical protein IIA85_00275 [Nanoarchaeota archaeon]|nr:hypothetical protein [Nanoarchaeota archaeon]
MPSIANILSDSVKGQYFRNAHTGRVIEALELIYPCSQVDPNEKFFTARNPLTGEFLSIPYGEIVEYLTLSDAEAVHLRNHFQEHSERLERAAGSVESQYLQPGQN